MMQPAKLGDGNDLALVGPHGFAGLRSILLEGQVNRGLFNHRRPHQGLGQGVPEAAANMGPATGRIERDPILGGLHHAYRRASQRAEIMVG